MTVFGNYQRKKRGAHNIIEPTIFVVSNWSVLCKACLPRESPPKLTVLSGLEHDPKNDTAAMFIEPNYGEVMVNKTDLEIDCQTISLAGMNPLGLLWGVPAGMLRRVLFRKNLLQKEDMLDVACVTEVGKWPATLLLEIAKGVNAPRGSEMFKIRFDLLVVQSLVQGYCQQLSEDTELDTERLGKMITLKKSSADPELLKLELRQP